MESETHKHLKRVALRWLKERVTDVVANEVDFYRIRSVADAVGLNLKRREVRVVEVKATKGDLLRDKKLFDDGTSYLPHVQYAYVMCPTGVIQPHEVPNGYGLLWVDEYDNVKTVKRPVKNTVKPKTPFDVILRATVRTLSNNLLYRDERVNERDETAGEFSRNAVIKLISIKCPTCRRSIRELIHKDDRSIIRCRRCGADIDLSKARVREITGFNRRFISRLNRISAEFDIKC